jgi:kynureninase
MKTSRAGARDRDSQVDSALRRHDFHLLPAAATDNSHVAYLAGNSLGLQPKATAAELGEELRAWQELAVHGHTEAERQWFPYHELLTESAARLVGARPVEVVMMNSLSVNLHLLLVSFYRPNPQRNLIMIEDSAFSSDSYVVRSQAAFHGFDPDTAVIRLRPRPGEDVLRTDDVLATMHANAERVATVLLGAVNYRTGELMDIPRITAAGHDIGATVGWDLAHAAGNVPLQLHDWDVDFAAWCTYKYLNSGPGAVAGAFIHERHLGEPHLPRFEGWWSTNPETRFEMNPVCDPQVTAEAWALSNPPILALGPVRTSLTIFDDVGMPALRARSIRLTDYLFELLDEVSERAGITVITPRETERHGAQVSVRVPKDAKVIVDRMRVESDVIADERPPDIIRLAPAPLYCTFDDCWRAVDALLQALDQDGLS